LPAAKNQKKNESGDTILETDSESYILSKQIEEDRGPRDFLDSIDALLESGCFDSSARSEVLSSLATQGVDGAYGVPIEMPNMVVLKEGEAVGPAQGQMMLPGEHPGGGGGGTGIALSAAAGQGSGSGGNAVGDGGGQGFGGVPGTGGRGSVGYVGVGTSVGDQDGAGAGIVPAGLRGMVSSPNSGTFIDLVEASVQRSLLEEKGNPERSYTSLARILRNTGVDKILEKFSPERRQELGNLSPEHLAAEYFQDTALQIAGRRIAAAEGEGQKIQLEEEVEFVLARSLQATHMA